MTSSAKVSSHAAASKDFSLLMHKGNYAYHRDQNSKLYFAQQSAFRFLVRVSQAEAAAGINQLVFVIESVLVFTEVGRYICQYNVD
jgi:hypothetical protein